MRRSQLFGETLREIPADTEIESHQLLVRGGFIQSLAAGIFSFLPLGERVRHKIEQILRAEMEAIGAQEVSLPVVHPAEIWRETGRWYDVGPELVRFKDRGDRDMVLAMTHEEVVADLLRKHVRSYRQLPVVLYQLQTKFRDEPRARGGLIRVREFVMKDAYSCHTTFEDLDRYYPEMYQAYFNVFRRAGINPAAVRADVGMMGGTMAHEFMYLSDVGEDQLVLCDSCGYAANRQVAEFQKGEPEFEEPRALEEVATPATATIAALAQLLQVPTSRTAKAAFFVAGDRLVFAVVRGDMEVNETKLINAVGSTDLRPARAEELGAAGIVAGYASPIGVTGTTVVVDDLVAQSANLVAGANKPGFHFQNTNFQRDYQADIVTDIATAFEGARCIRCAHELRLVRGVEVGNIFKLGTKYSEGLGATFLDEQGQEQFIVMGSYGIGIGRLMACIAQGYRDEKGLMWPVTVAPFQICLVGLDLTDPSVSAAAEELYGRLIELGIEVLFDDRPERAGVKFNDADLLGIPLRATVSRRTLQRGMAEVKARSAVDAYDVPLADATTALQTELQAMTDAVLATVVPEPFVNGSDSSAGH